MEEKVNQLEKQLEETNEELEDSILASQDIFNDTKEASNREEVETSIDDHDDSAPAKKNQKN